MVNAYQKADAILSMVDQAPSMKLDDNNNEKILGTDTDIRIISWCPIEFSWLILRTKSTGCMEKICKALYDEYNQSRKQCTGYQGLEQSKV